MTKRLVDKLDEHVKISERKKRAKVFCSEKEDCGGAKEDNQKNRANM